MNGISLHKRFGEDVDNFLHSCIIIEINELSMDKLPNEVHMSLNDVGIFVVN